MPRNTLEGLARAHVPGEGPVVVQPLLTGMVNRSCRVERAGRLFFLRAAPSTSADLGIDRVWECRVLARAAAAGVAPPVEYCDPVRGVLVADWSHGRSWTADEACLPENIDAMARLLRRVHAVPIPQPARSLHPAAWIDHYRRLAERQAVAAAPSANAPAAHLRAAAALQLTRLDETGGRPEPVLCHSDLHRLNVSAGPQLVLLDWEYAHESDPYWDLAGWSANNDWPEECTLALLVRYLGRPGNPTECARLRCMLWLYDYVCLLWSEVYSRLRTGPEAGAAAARAERLKLRLRANAP